MLNKQNIEYQKFTQEKISNLKNYTKKTIFKILTKQNFKNQKFIQEKISNLKNYSSKRQN